MKKGTYINKLPNGNRLGNEKASHIASFCDEELDVLPDLNHIPAGLILIVVVNNINNGGYESALVCDNKYDWDRVHAAVTGGLDKRPMRFFLVKREWVRQMTDDLLEGEE